MNSIPFSFDAPLTQVTDEAVHPVSPPSQTADGEEYICGNTGPGFPGNNPGRDQDRSRSDECQYAQAFARYIS